MSKTRICRRRFLKTGCLTMATAGLAICGISGIVPGPPPFDLSTHTYGETNMNNRILVAYATATGSTVDVASAIGETLAGHSLSVDVRPIQEEPQIGDYQAVLLGSAVQHGNWLPEAVDFVKDNEQALNRVPVALFCVHIQNRGHDEISRQNRLAYLDEVRPLLKPVAEGYFGGRFNRHGAALLMPGLLARFVPTIDLRNWEKIQAWTDSLTLILRQPA